LVALTSRALLVLPAICATAHAEGERALSLSGGFASFSTPGKKMGTMEPPTLSPDWGASLSGVYERTLGSDLELRGELAGALFRGGIDKGETPTSYAGLVDVGLVFRFDVSEFVPYAFGGIGGIVSGGGPIDRGTEGVLALGGGCDWLRSRDRSWGAEVRMAFDISSPGKGQAGLTNDFTLVTLGVRYTSRWGFF
jgi:hypothetical protein